jgi:hypothetical protein
MYWGKSSAKEYEEHVERSLKRKYPKAMWQMEKQSPIKSRGTTLKVDFIITNRKTGRQVVVDAKSGQVSIGDLRQLEEYKIAAKASKCIIYTPTPIRKLSEGIKYRAKKSGIEIHCSVPRESF